MLSIINCVYFLIIIYLFIIIMVSVTSDKWKKNISWTCGSLFADTLFKPNTSF